MNLDQSPTTSAGSKQITAKLRIAQGIIISALRPTNCPCLKLHKLVFFLPGRVRLQKKPLGRNLFDHFQVGLRLQRTKKRYQSVIDLFGLIGDYNDSPRHRFESAIFNCQLHAIQKIISVCALLGHLQVFLQLQLNPF